MKKFITVIILWALASACGGGGPRALEEIEDWRVLLGYDMSKDPDWRDF